MNYNMYTNKRPDSIDPNYIYPQPYIDPIMYMNNEAMSYYNTNNTQTEYPTYSNQYADNPTYASYSEPDYDNYVDEMYSNMNNFTNIPVMPPNMMFPGMMMPHNMMYPGAMNQGMVPPNMMYPGMMPYMNMMPNYPTVNMDEFDEEEM